MKKYLFIVLLVGLGSSQTLYTGLGYSNNMYNENDILDFYDMSSFNGYHYGVEYSLSNISFGVGVNLTGNRAKLKTTQVEVVESYEYMSAQLTYSYPIMDKYKPFVGLMIGDYVFADATISGIGSAQQDNIEIDHFNSLLVGLDYMFMPSLGLRLTYAHGLNDIGQPVSAGMYIYTIQAGEHRDTKKMLFLK